MPSEADLRARRYDPARVSSDPQYSLALSPDEVERYRFMAQMARAEETEAWAEAGIAEGATIVDLGCGPGLLLAELADVVGPGGRVAGVDRQDAAIATARQVIADGGLDQATVRHGDAWDSGLELGTWDLVNIRHVLAHNTADNVARIVEHAFALLRPGGTLFLLDVDLSGMRVVPQDDDIDDLAARYLEHLSDTGRDATLGPRLGTIVVAAGFEIANRHQTIMMPPARRDDRDPPSRLGGPRRDEGVGPRRRRRHRPVGCGAHPLRHRPAARGRALRAGLHRHRPQARRLTV